MMRSLKSLKLALGSVAAGLFLAACGGAVTPLTTPLPNIDGLTEDSAEVLEDFSLTRNDMLLAMMSSPSNVGLQLSAARAESLPAPAANILNLMLDQGLLSTQQDDDDDVLELGCVTVSGDGSDADGDDIPVNFKLSIECEFEDGKASLRGSMTISDKDDNNPESGYTVDIPLLVATETTTSGESRLELKQNFDLDIAPNQSSYSIDHQLDLKGSDPQEGTGEYTENAILSYTPDDLGDPFTAGTFDTDNRVSFSDGIDRYTLNEETLPTVHFDASCETGFDRGAVRYTDSLGNTLEFTFNACNDVSVRFQPA